MLCCRDIRIEAIDKDGVRARVNVKGLDELKVRDSWRHCGTAFHSDGEPYSVVVPEELKFETELEDAFNKPALSTDEKREAADARQGHLSAADALAALRADPDGLEAFDGDGVRWVLKRGAVYPRRYGAFGTDYMGPMFPGSYSIREVKREEPKRDPLEVHITEGRAKAIAVAAVQQMHGEVLRACEERLAAMVETAVKRAMVKEAERDEATPRARIVHIATNVAKRVVQERWDEHDRVVNDLQRRLAETKQLLRIAEARGFAYLFPPIVGGE